MEAGGHGFLILSVGVSLDWPEPRLVVLILRCRASVEVGVGGAGEELFVEVGFEGDGEGEEGQQAEDNNFLEHKFKLTYLVN